MKVFQIDDKDSWFEYWLIKPPEEGVHYFVTQERWQVAPTTFGKPIRFIEKITLVND